VRLGGYQKSTLSDFPGKTAAIVFTQGCNFRCPFCHNGRLLPGRTAPTESISEEEVMGHLKRRAGVLQGLVITGGEPTLQLDLVQFVERVKELGYAVKLDTNGSRPEVLRVLFERGLLDYVAMDVKAPMERYDILTGVDSPKEAIRESIQLIAESGVSHHFRTTLVEALLSAEDLAALQLEIPKGSRYITQKFIPDNALAVELRGYQKLALQA